MSSDIKPITRADIDAKLAQIKGDVDETVESTTSAARAVAIVAVAIVVVAAFVIGRRRGRKRTTLVEIRRV